jgi:hypothetical protein
MSCIRNTDRNPHNLSFIDEDKISSLAVVKFLTASPEQHQFGTHNTSEVIYEEQEEEAEEKEEEEKEKKEEEEELVEEFELVDIPGESEEVTSVEERLEDQTPDHTDGGRESGTAIDRRCPFRKYWNAKFRFKTWTI